ncbi:MAG: 5-formyltetrahydrofolate cyclo-ligase [Nitrospiraceae bacterium]|nr:5-formyltetrahydrofolate cyclo-ligase [Nitrospiraceae bacterium]
MDKGAFRAGALKRRASLTAGQKLSNDNAIRQRLSGLDEFKAAGTILFYASFKSEVETMPLIEQALAGGKKILLPKVKGGGLELFEIKETAGLAKGFMGIPEPTGKERPASVDEADIVIVPGVAFDTEGGRLGYGKGYYDKLLSKAERRIPLVALAYEAQVFSGERLPLEPHDIKMDKIITEKRTIISDGH